MEERYLSICVLSDMHETDHACSSLERAGIPVIIQHLSVHDERERSNAPQVSSYRLLVPMRYTQAAMSIIQRGGPESPAILGGTDPLPRVA
ncbi:MAG: hypothetical protein EBZ48_02070 [Proteobacteria bacterium]|nr:hypothetical protein [Pseudomonadota bacterium]